MKTGLCDTCRFWGGWSPTRAGCQSGAPRKYKVKNGEVVECDGYMEVKK